MRRGDECFITLQIAHLLCHSKAYNGQVRVGFLINKQLNYYIVRVNSISPSVAELVIRITKRYKLKIAQVYAPKASYPEEDIHSFYNDDDDTFGKPIQYT